MAANKDVREHFDNIAPEYDSWKKKNHYYYSQLKEFYKRHIRPGSAIVEFGSGTADILHSCRPAKALGIDVSTKILEIAKRKYPDYEFEAIGAEDFLSDQKFDYVIMSDVVEHLDNIPKAIENAYRALSPRGKLIITSINPIWNPLFGILEKLKLKMPEGPHCFIPNSFIAFLCQVKGFATAEKGALLVFPKKTIFLFEWLNRVVPKIFILNRLCLVQTLIAQKDGQPRKKLSYSVLIPAYNERGNIAECIRRIPTTERDYEIIVVDDGSGDDTVGLLKELGRENSRLKYIRFEQNRGKAYAVKTAIMQAEKEVIVILDADISVAPEEIILFVEALESAKADFVNGTRLVYNLDKRAMSQIKKMGNFLSAVIFSLFLRYRVTDTLCGTKAFYRKDFLGINMSDERWGDYALLNKARRQGLRVKEIPVRYHERKFGYSKMRPFVDCAKFLLYIFKMALGRKED